MLSELCVVESAFRVYFDPVQVHREMSKPTRFALSLIVELASLPSQAISNMLLNAVAGSMVGG